MGLKSLGSSGCASTWARWASMAATVVVVMVASAQDAAANCTNGPTTQTITGPTGSPAGRNLYDAMAGATAPCTITVDPGTYNAPIGLSLQFPMSAGITVRS